MCWYSADHAGKIAQAETGQRLVTRKVHDYTWAVAESDLETRRPTPVCLLDGTRVIFRSAENAPPNFTCTSETEATFRMLKSPKRDVFQLPDGQEIEVNTLPAKLVFDVLEIPGKEELAAILKGGHAEDEVSATTHDRRSLLDRVLAFF